MHRDVLRLAELNRSGSCCAVALVELALELKGEKNELLVKAASALCGGIRNGMVCGALTGAACALEILAPEDTERIIVSELAAWFEKRSREDYGGPECRRIREARELEGEDGCASLVEAVWIEARNLLVKYGFDAREWD
ncbi:MAG TPA: C-GCAxxG-C-C family protein [Rectinemataceae bacterium]|nr:C-GCAxxG-C-C family protein [Rectinemataceae bacterium]